MVWLVVVAGSVTWPWAGRNRFSTFMVFTVQYGDLKNSCNLLVIISWNKFILCVIGLGDFVPGGSV